MTSGAVLLDKPADITSFAVLSSVKRAFDTRRVGHTGTLDRFATGLMVVLVGKATRLATAATNQDKSYLFDIVFGSETDTLDPTGEVVAEGPIPERSDVEGILGRFTGDLVQVPPAYSAVHVDGRRASQLARSGQTPTLEARNVHIAELTLTSMEGRVARMEASCSKGTYIRSLARDIARELGTVAHVGRLRRTRVGAFNVSEANLPDAVGRDDLMAPDEFLKRLGGVGFARLKASMVERIRHGVPLEEGHFTGGMPEESVIAVRDPAGRVVAVVEWRHGRLEYRVVFS